ncbi:hypothetical protein [Aeoliella mucimassa]|uniref:hypothetical protein n=1 Tax=Aeoliella mucimassa TaxID=2527972 RepID=UPI0018D40A74|nr:hypothetical protein [Aeoliella mucimassa]
MADHPIKILLKQASVMRNGAQVHRECRERLLRTPHPEALDRSTLMLMRSSLLSLHQQDAEVYDSLADLFEEIAKSWPT